MFKKLIETTTPEPPRNEDTNSLTLAKTATTATNAGYVAVFKSCVVILP